MRHDGACWSARAWAVACCAPTVMSGATDESCMLSGDSGTWRNCSVEPRREGSRPGVLRTNGPTTPCGCTPSPRRHGDRLDVGKPGSAGARGQEVGPEHDEDTLGGESTMVRVRTKERGRRATVILAPELTAEQRKSVKIFDLGRWIPVEDIEARFGGVDLQMKME